ncbi:MAG: nucleoside kinase [Bacteroidales bacterium]|nr:nucleoside kinase [Bacteroidales bacterium]
MNNNQVEIIIENTGERRLVAQGISLKELAADCPSLTRYPIVGALVNNRIEHLDYRIYNPKVVRLFDYTSKEGMRMYKTSLTFLLYKAVRDCYSQADLEVEHSLLSGYYCRIWPEGRNRQEMQTPSASAEVAERVATRMRELQQADLPFENQQMLLTDAVELIKQQNLPETEQLLSGLGQLYINMQRLGDKLVKLGSPLVPSTGILSCWNLQVYEQGYLLQCPTTEHPDTLSPIRNTPKLFNIFQEHHRWVELLRMPTIEQLNRIVRDRGENHLIHVSEALHEKKYAAIADNIYQSRGQLKMVLLAGPSSSGKTTSCRRLSVQLSVLGFDVQQLSLDDYFVPREQTPRQPNGDHDFEALGALNIPLLNDHLLRLFKGERVEIPTYDFIKGAPYYSGKALQMQPNSILVVEGIHALNPQLTAQIPDETKYKVYVSALTQVAIDDLNLIHSSDNRLIRRIVRDYNFRGYSAHNTLKRWESVQRGEHRHIFPYQENADIMFNSALLYELGILKVYAEPQLKKVPENCPEYAEASRLLSFIEMVEPIDPKFIPPTSIMREFLGGSSFKY